MPDYTRLKGVLQVGDNTLTSMLQDNLVEFFNWGLIDKGGFF